VLLSFFQNSLRIYFKRILSNLFHQSFLQILLKASVYDGTKIRKLNTTTSYYSLQYGQKSFFTSSFLASRAYNGLIVSPSRSNTYFMIRNCLRNPIASYNREFLCIRHELLVLCVPIFNYFL
jgi:hypothetical protein